MFITSSSDMKKQFEKTIEKLNVDIGIRSRGF